MTSHRIERHRLLPFSGRSPRSLLASAAIGAKGLHLLQIQDARDDVVGERRGDGIASDMAARTGIHVLHDADDPEPAGMQLGGGCDIDVVDDRDLRDTRLRTGDQLDHVRTAAQNRHGRIEAGEALDDLHLEISRDAQQDAHGVPPSTRTSPSWEPSTARIGAI